MKVLSRRFLQGGREEILYEEDASLRLGRLFRSAASLEHIRKLLALASDSMPPVILCADRLEEAENGRILVSLDAADLSTSFQAPAPLKSLLLPLDALHSTGWLSLDLASSPFAVRGKEPVLIWWPDPVLPGTGCELPPEVAAGGVATPSADYWGLGRLLKATKGHLWSSGGNPEPVDDLRGASFSRRLTAATAFGLREAGRVPPLPKPFPKLPRSGLAMVEGGSWMSRDALVNEWVTSAISRGWPARVVRCRPAEKWRPLPDRRPGGPAVSSAADLLAQTFPDVSGVSRLLVVDGLEHASSDLVGMLDEMVEVAPPNLCVVLASSIRITGIRGDPAVRVEPADASSSAGDGPVENVAGGGWAEPCWYGTRRRTDAENLPGGPEMDAASVFAEGGYREVASAWERGALPKPMSSMAARCFLVLGHPERALELAEGADRLLRAKILLELRRADEAESLLMEAVISGRSDPEPALLLAGMLADKGLLSEAAAMLDGAQGPEPVVLQSRIMDLQGRPAEALSRLGEALEHAQGLQRVDLICARVNILMRLGFYAEAVRAADEAVTLSRAAAHLPSLRKSLQERGRVREVTGAWRDALEDYRLAVLFTAESGLITRRPPSVDLFILEMKMGLARSAFETFVPLGRFLLREEEATSLQLLDMLEAASGVMLGRGGRSLPAAERGAATAGRIGMPLRQGLCLLYSGQLLLQDGQKEEAARVLGHSRAIAGLLGDRHLALLADLAGAQADLPMEPGDLAARAAELGLVAETLEAAAITASEEEHFRRAIESLLTLPSPLRACELAARRASHLDAALRRRLWAARDAVIAQLDEDDAGDFRRLTSGLDSTAAMPAARREGLPEEQVRTLSTWLSRYLAGLSDLPALVQQLGLDRLSLEPSGKTGELEAGCEDGPIYISGSGAEEACALAPLLRPFLAAPLQPLEDRPGAGDRFPEILGRSSRITSIKSAMLRVAKLPVPVLVTGETGSGKELVARGIHRAGPRCGRAFVPVDCGAIPESLIESELFGARRGAYTDMRTDRSGLLEAASGGTLFLDEIGNLPQASQVKLLRALETGCIRRLGDTSETVVDFRLIAATNSDLASRVADGKFRPDLYYRIAVMVVDVPALRERPDDIPLLARAFASQLCAGSAPAVGRAALRKLMSHCWPGNIRELRNVIQRAVLLCDSSTIREEDIVFGEQLPGGDAGPARLEPLDMAAARHARGVLDAVGGSRTRAAEILRCDPKTLRKYLKLYDERLDRKGEPRR